MTLFRRCSTRCFRRWFSGFAFAAIAIGALVPAAVMCIGAANLFTRNFWKAYVEPDVSHAGEAKVAKITSLVVKVGALVSSSSCRRSSRSTCSCSAASGSCRPFPALVFGLFSTGSARRRCLPAGPSAWRAAAGSRLPTASSRSTASSSSGSSYTLYTGLIALVLNIVVAVLVQLVIKGAPLREPPGGVPAGGR